MNRFDLIGNLAKDPKLETSQAGVPYCNVRIAVYDETSAKDDGVDYFTVTFYRKKAEDCAKCLKQGYKVRATCKVKPTVYTDKNGQKKDGTDYIGKEFELLSKKGGDTQHVGDG